MRLRRIFPFRLLSRGRPAFSKNLEPPRPEFESYSAAGAVC